MSNFKSNWTPINNKKLNEKVFDERKNLIEKWSEKWTDKQKSEIIEIITKKINYYNIEKIKNIINKKKKFIYFDFTVHLPRIISIIIFSFLDPRSLSRCAQVCWRWKWITELDQLWMKRCLKLGWVLPSNHHQPPIPSPWKQLYIDNMFIFKSSIRLTSSRLSLKNQSTNKQNSLSQSKSSIQNINKPLTNRRPPWRGSDPKPKDIWRNNQLDNNYN